MKVLSKKRAGALCVAVAFIAVVVVSLGGPAGGATPPVFQLPPFPGDGGVLRLHLGDGSDYFRFDAVNTTGTAEPLVTNKCAVVAPKPTSAVITPTPNGGSSQGVVGLVNHSLGVGIKGEGTGTPCGQANGTTQTLRVSLAGQLATKSMDSAELDIEGKFNVKVRADLFQNSALVRTEFLTFGGSDSGPDSGPSDNRRWKLPSSGTLLFDEIKLSVDSSTPGGAFSLEGGSDGTPRGTLGTALNTSDTLFHISGIDGTLECGQTVTEGGGGQPSASITLVGLAENPDCESVPYALTTINSGDLQAVAFQKSGGDLNIYKATLTWPVEEKAYPPPPTLIDYGDGSGPHPLVQCDGTYASPILPSGEAWCVNRHESKTASTGFMQVIEELYGRGDPGYWR